MIYSLRAALQRVDPGLLSHCNADTQSKTKCDCNKSTLQHSTTAEEDYKNNNQVEADKLISDAADAPPDALTPEKMN